MNNSVTDLTSNLTELNTLYVDLDELIKTVDEEEKQLGDYRRIGVLIREKNSKQRAKQNLSQVMYREVTVEGYGTGQKLLVDEAMFDQKRYVIADGIIKALALFQANEEKSVGSKIDLLKKMIKAVIWLRDEIKVEFPKDLVQAREVFSEYKTHLSKVVKSGKFGLGYASDLHRAMLWLLRAAVDSSEQEITNDIGVLIDTNNVPNVYSCATYTQKELAYAFAFYFHLFDQVADFLLENKPYPYVITLPRGKAVLLPSHNINIATAYEPPEMGNRIVDYGDGHILNDEEIEMAIAHIPTKGGKQKSAKDSYKNAKKKLSKLLPLVNNQSNHPYRLRLGSRAMSAWYMSMLFITGMNDSTQACLKWSEDDEFNLDRTDRKEFRAIKYRARNKNVRFEIRNAFIESFRKYVRLRRFVLNGHDYEYLFFGGHGANAQVRQDQFKGTLGNTLSKSFSIGLDAKLPLAKAGDARKDMARDALNSHDMQTAINLLQNNQPAFLKHYCGNTIEEEANSLYSFFKDVDGVVNGKPMDPSQATAVGECDCEGELTPKRAHEEIPVEPDCQDPKTCIFCESFRTHPEREEIRKLLSLEYLIRENSLLRAENLEFYNETFEPWLVRIDALFEAMKEDESDTEELIDEIRHEVFQEGALTPYWLEWEIMFDLSTLFRTKSATCLGSHFFS